MLSNRIILNLHGKETRRGDAESFWVSDYCRYDELSGAPQPTDGSLELTFSDPITLSGTDAFEFRVTAAEVSTGSLGVHTGINGITFNGTVFSTESPTITSAVSDGFFILKWGGGAHNVETNDDLQSSGWSVYSSNAVPPFTNAIGENERLFYRLVR